MSMLPPYQIAQLEASAATETAPPGTEASVSQDGFTGFSTPVRLTYALLTYCSTLKIVVLYYILQAFGVRLALQGRLPTPHISLATTPHT